MDHVEVLLGTNYYLLKKPCPTCGHAPERVHIGKSSAGWCFALHVIPEEAVNDLDDWKRLWGELQDSSIQDEYGRAMTLDEMLVEITNRSWTATLPYGYKDWGDFHARNQSEPGPNGLVRSRIDGDHCIGHGDGTWDLIKGEFS